MKLREHSFLKCCFSISTFLYNISSGNKGSKWRILTCFSYRRLLEVAHLAKISLVLQLGQNPFLQWLRFSFPKAGARLSLEWISRTLSYLVSIFSWLSISFFNIFNPFQSKFLLEGSLQIFRLQHQWITPVFERGNIDLKGTKCLAGLPFFYNVFRVGTQIRTPFFPTSLHFNRFNSKKTPQI